MRKLLTLAMTMMLVILITIPVMAETEVTNHEYTEIFAGMTGEDYENLRKVVYWESAIADCPISTDIAVVRTVMNRVLDPEWPNTVTGVIRQKGQFWTRNFGKTVAYPETVDDAINYVYLNGAEDFPIDSTYFATKRQSCAKDHQWIGGRKADGSPLKGKGMWFARKK